MQLLPRTPLEICDLDRRRREKLGLPPDTHLASTI